MPADTSKASEQNEVHFEEPLVNEITEIEDSKSIIIEPKQFVENQVRNRISDNWMSVGIHRCKYL